MPLLEILFLHTDKAAWRNGIASDYDRVIRVIRRLQVRPLRWS